MTDAPRVAGGQQHHQADGLALVSGDRAVALAAGAPGLRKHELAGLTPTQLAALATVERSGPMRLGDLAAAEGYRPVHAHPAGDRRWRRAATCAGTPTRATRGPAPDHHPAPAADTLDRLRTESTLVLGRRACSYSPAQRSALAEALPVLELLAEVPGTDPAGPRA